MKSQFILFLRHGVYYSEDTATGRQNSLRTKDKADALRLLHAKNEATHQPAMNLQIAQVYLQHGDKRMNAWYVAFTKRALAIGIEIFSKRTKVDA